MSALRINLLPAYLAEVERTKVAIAAFATLFVVAVAGSLFYFSVRQHETTELEAQADQKEQEATAATAVVNKIKGESAALRAQIAPIGDRVNFVKEIYFYNTWVQKIYRRAAHYTDSRVEYSSMAVNAGTLSMSGYVMSVEDLSRYLITFYGNPDVTAVSVSGPPGWKRPSQVVVNPLEGQNPAVAKGFSFSVNATLLKALQKPVLPTSLDGEPAVTEAGPAGAATGAAGAKTGAAAPAAPVAPGAAGTTNSGD